MEPDRIRTLTNLKMRLLVQAHDKKRLQTIVAYSQSHERRKQALLDLADLLQEIRVVADELARLEGEG